MNQLHYYINVPWVRVGHWDLALENHEKQLAPPLQKNVHGITITTGKFKTQHSSHGDEKLSGFSQD